MAETMTANARPSASLKCTVVLVGMMGSGKSAIGRALAARLGVPFRDSDAEIEAAANATIAEIFERDGEPFFRAREAEVIARLLDSAPAILSTGGGAFMTERNREAIAKRGIALWLNVPLDVLWERVRHKETRPLLRTADPLGTLTQILHDREPIYANAGLQLNVAAGHSIDVTTTRAADLLATRPEILEAQP